MNRVDHPCPGDCARCGLLADGKVDMMPCVLDQIFRRVQRLEDSINQLKEMQVAEQTVAALGHNEEKYVQEDDGAGSQRRRGQRKDDVAEHRPG